MNYKHILILLALCLCIVPAIATSADYHSKYSNPNLVTVGTTGFLEGTIRCGTNVFTHEIGVRNDANPLGKNGSFTYYPISPDGKFADFNGNSRIELIPGSFSLHIVDGQGGQPEDSHATIVAGQISYPEEELLGHAVSPSAEVKPTKTIRIYIQSATYGDNKKSVDIKNQLQQLVNGGDRSFQFDIATIKGLTNSDSISVPGGDPVPGIVKYATVSYFDEEGGHVKMIMEQDFNNPYTYPSAQVPYSPVSLQTTLNI